MTLWNRIDITVCMELVSADPSGVLTALQQQGFELHDVRWIDDLTIRFCVSGKQFRALERIAAGKGYELKILQRKGMLYTLQRFTRRPVLVFCLLLFLLAGFYLPSRIFFLQVEGNSIVPTNLILEKASACGICFGASRSEVRSEKMKNALLEAIPQLQWAGVNTQGCVAVISVRERSEPDTDVQERVVSSIVAARDGVITSITATKGSALCTTGQAVKEGQILISGYTDLGLVIRAQRAEGEIYAQTERQLTVISPASAVFNGQILRSEEKYSVIIGKKRINFYFGSGILPASCVKMYEQRYMSLPGGFYLPIAIVTEVWETRQTDPFELPLEQAESQLQAVAKDYLTEQMIGGRIHGENTVLSTMDGMYLLEGTYDCHEMIGQIRIEETIHTNE